MLGLVEWRGAGLCWRMEERRIGGVRFAVVRVLRGTGLRARWSARRAARRLARAGVRRVVFPGEFPLLPVFARCDVLPVDEQPLRQAAAAEIVRCVMAQYGVQGARATVVICARRATRAVADCAAALTETVRYLRLCVPEGGEELARRLRFMTGAAVPAQFPPEQPREGDILLCFDDSFDAAQPRGIVLRLADPALRISYHLPGGIEAGESDAVQLLAALYAADRLPEEEVRVTAVTLPA